MTDFNDLSGQNVLVTGASGFIGSALSSRLCGLGAKVFGVSRSREAGHAQDIEWLESNLNDIDDVKKIIKTVKPDYIFHLASHVAGARDVDLVLPTFKSNLASTVNLLTAATGAGCKKIILTGSLEESALPSSPYAAAKMASSAYGRMFHALYQEPVAIMRLFMVYGPNQKDLKKLIPYVTLSLLRGESPVCSGGGRMVDWIYVDDVVDGYISVALKSGVEGETIDIGSGELHSVREVVETLAEIVNPDIKPEFSSLLDRVLEQEQIADIEKTKKLIDWEPKTKLIDGLRKTVEWYKNK